MQPPWKNWPEQIPTVTLPEYESGRGVRFGRSNPELMDVPFWHVMIRTGWSAYRAYKFANEHLQASPKVGGPGWCFSRFGMAEVSLSPDWSLFIAGEHEDSYDDDFQIYNDVIVRNRDGGIWIYGYPPEIFPPTDFHTATYYDYGVFIIGNLGYLDARRWRETPVYRLDLANFSIDKVHTKGEGPGWIHGHVAIRNDESVITILGGKRISEDGKFKHNNRVYQLELESLTWQVLDSPIGFGEYFDTGINS